jgi:hypothetical protein
MYELNPTDHYARLSYALADDDRLLGGPGNDVLDGGRGRDVCIGGPGVDVFIRCQTARQ